MYPSSLIPHRENEYDLKLIHPKYFMGARMKVFFENLCKFYSSLGDTKYTAIRHTNVYGPYDKFDLKRGHVLSATVEKVMTATDKIVVWGQGQERRDFLYITDLIGFIEQALEKQESGFDLFNVSFGKTYSIKELAQKIVDLSGKKLSIDYDLTKSSIDTVISINNSKARRILGWRPAIDIDAGIRQTIDWYLKNKWSENG
jgi:GDP-L-fucose synthase